MVRTLGVLAPLQADHFVDLVGGDGEQLLFHTEFQFWKFILDLRNIIEMIIAAVINGISLMNLH